MTDDRQVRTLLTHAAELPDNIQPSVAHLVRTARRTRRLHFAGSVLAIVILVAAAFVLPQKLGSLLPTSVSGSPDNHHAPSQPSAFLLSQYSWSELDRSPLGARSKPLLAWTGSKLLELGGNKNGVTQNDGAAFDPRTERWALIAPVKANVGFSHAVDAWTGRELFVTNGQTAPCPASVPVSRCLPQAGLYNPATNRWTTTLLPQQLDGLHLAGAAWNGHEVVVAGTSTSPPRLRVAAYTPATGRWRMISPRVPRGHPPSSAAIVATPSRVLLWSLWSRAGKVSKRSSEITSGVDVLAFARDGQWTDVTGNWPQGQTVGSPSYANGQVLGVSDIWCGPCYHPEFAPWPFLANAATLTRTEPNESRAPPRTFGSFWLWNGRAVLTGEVRAFGKGAALGRLYRLAAWDPASRRWYVFRTTPPHKPALAADPIFAGGQLLVLASSGTLLTLHAMFA
jgi:hypothetical protein